MKLTAATLRSTSRLESEGAVCPLCERHTSLTFHHLIPRKMHRRNYFRRHFDQKTLQMGIYICRDCHSGIHRLYDEMRLAKEFCTIDAIQKDPAIQKHCNWVAKQKVRA